MKIWKKTMLLAFCFAMTATVASCDINSVLGGLLGDGSETTSEVESIESESTPEESESEAPVDSDSTSEEDVKVEYTVTFKQDGYDDIVMTVEKGKGLAEVPTPQPITGYTVAWDKTNFAKITKDTVVTAVATANTYTVTYDVGDATAETATVTYDAAYELATPAKEGFKFVGWTYNDAAFDATGVWTIAEDVTLVAQWQAVYTVTFVQDGCDDVVKSVLDGEALTDIPAPQDKVGYTVVWDTTDFSCITGNVTVNAVATANTYKITFDMNGGEGAPATMDVTFDAPYELPAPTKTDYNFVAWMNGENALTATGTWNIASDVTLVANWVEKDKCAIIFQEEGYADVTKYVTIGSALTDIPAPQGKTGYTVVWDTTDFSNISENITVKAVATANTYTVTYEGGATMAVTYDAPYELATPVQDGYKFLGWFNGEAEMAMSGTWTIANNVTLTAKWQKIHTVTFVQNGCDNIVKTVLDGEALAEVPEVQAKVGYTIAWDITDFSAVTGDMTVTAVETANKYTITYNANGGDAVEAQEVTFDAAFTLATPTHAEYQFIGWYLMDGDVITDTKFEAGVWAIDGDVTVIAKWGVAEGEYAMKYNFNVTDAVVTQITRKAYPGGSTVSFKYFIPAGTTTGWWGIAWHTDASLADNYHTAGIDGAIGYQKLETETGVWTTAIFTLPEGGEYYLYFGSEMDGSKWNVDGATSYALIDNFKVGSVYETFNNGIEASIFKSNVAGGIEIGDGYTAPAVEEGEYALKYMFNADGVSMITKQGYPGGSKVSFKYFIPKDAIIDSKNWWGVAWHNDPSKADMYHAANIHDPVGHKSIKWVQGTWVDFEFTIEGDADTLYYLYFGSNVGNAQGGWNMPDGSDAYVLFDDFTINGVTDNFNKHIDASIFDVLKPNKVVLSEKGEGYFVRPFEEGEYAMKYVCNASGETVSQVTKKAYKGGSTVSFQYYIPEGTVTSWWGIGWSTTNTGLDIYATASNSTGYQPGAKTGEWVTVSFTLPEGGEYYLYFGSEIGASHGRWMLNGENAYILIDNFKVSGESTEDFNSPIDKWAFDILFPGAVMLSDKGEGIANTTPDLPEIEEPEAGEYGAKIQIDLISSTPSTPSFITKQAYTFTEDTVVSFDYYMSGNTNGKWWTLSWTNDNKVADIYAHVGSNKDNNNGIDLPRNVQDTWTTASVTVPAGTWYIYFAGAVGEWSGGSVIIDNVKFGDELVETFNDGTYGIFVDNRDSKPDAITIAGGKVAVTPDPTPDPEPDPTPDPTPDTPATGENGAKIYFDKISSTTSTPSFITTEAYTFDEDTVVTFDYYMSGNTLNKWWTLSWTNDKTVADIYAHVGSNKDNNDGKDLPTGVQDAWTTASVTVPAGTWYIYFGGAKGEWSGGYVIIDNVKFGDQVVADFNDGTYGIFEDNRDSEPDAITIAAGKVEEKFESGEYAMKYIFNASSEVVSQVTKQAYAGGSTVSFKYYIPEGTTTQWWGICWSTGNSGLDIYAAASTASAKPLSATVGAWTKVEFTLPEGGPYYLYFGSEVGNWKFENGDNAYVLIDDFTINGEKETFSNGVANSIFDVLVEGTVVEGDGYVPAPQGAKIMLNTISGTATTPSFITSKSYSGVATITFDCYITGNPDGKWWCLNWTADKANANIYAFNNNGNTSETANGRGITTDNQGTWQTVTIEIPEGEWYFFFGGEKGQWGDGYVILDNIVLKDADGNVIATETFDEGFTVFENNRATSISLVEGKTE